MDWNNCTQTATDANGTAVGNVATISCIIPFIQGLISAAFMFAGSIAAIVIILAGIKYVRSKGDPKNLQSAQQALTWGIVGLVIVIFAFFIVTFIGTVTGTTKSCLFGGILSGNLNCQ